MTYYQPTDQSFRGQYDQQDLPSPGGLHPAFAVTPPPSRPSFPEPMFSSGSSYTRAPSFFSDDGEYYNGMPQPQIPMMEDGTPIREKAQVTLDENGNYIYYSQVAEALRQKSEASTESVDREFSHIRYSAATCEPDKFKESGFTLRPIIQGRRTKLFIVVTMYNERDDLFARTMFGVTKNIAHLCGEKASLHWTEVVVCIVSDGRLKINHRTLKYITALGAYQTGLGTNEVNRKPVTAHIYEYTTQVPIRKPDDIEAWGFAEESVPVQLIFCLKEKNQKKLNSHRWFFEGFCPILNPEVCILIDVGTMPGPTALFHIWRAFEKNPKLGGACGEIVALKGQYWLNLFNPLVGAQNFEYKLSNILDKSLESVFGYISVLPGAFSAYRYDALQNDEQGQGPLQKYFLSEHADAHSQQNIFMANMYLAEDRILCWELVSKRKSDWTLHYIKSAYAITDVPDTVPELISQRRRWLNGSLFAALHSIGTFYRIWRSSHSVFRKLWIHVEMIYQLYNLIFAWFALGNYFIAYKILTEALEDKSFHLGNVINIINLVIEYIYVGLLIASFLLALGNRPQGSKLFYTIAMVGFALVTIYMSFASIFLVVRGIENAIHAAKPVTPSDLFVNPLFRNIVVSMFATLGLWVLASVIQLDAWHLVTSSLQYMLMAPSYINVLNVYAFANVHDVSWGTKGDTKTSKDLGRVKGKEQEAVEVLVPTEQSLRLEYEAAVDVMHSKPVDEEEEVDPQAEREASDRNFRTKYVPVFASVDVAHMYYHPSVFPASFSTLRSVLLTWALTNILLAAVVITASTKASSTNAGRAVNGYLAFLLFSIAGLAAVRFIGSALYMLLRLFDKE
ncbi:chitin synthase [Gelatoporia subvermispora B]|uniref:Chitin synthase n=1 Tax=Ceriporiopsis subvermispora (strain B) TaxID=914234 RepID=M2R913_CERS8|nr:chitin synthase [Gelatoporia subvermispora B]